MFILKKFISAYLLPIPIILTTLIVGILLLWYSKRERTAKILCSIATLLILIISYDLGPGALLAQLERQYRPLQLEKVKDVSWIVILGEGHSSDPALPPTAQLSHIALGRLIEGIRVHRQIAGSKMVLSGGPGFDRVSHAEIMRRAALSLGVSESSLVIEDKSLDTEDEARILKDMLGNRPFILVTSASHMPRSMALFRRYGTDPIAAPSDYWTKQRTAFAPGDLFPSSGGFRKLEVALHEYLGTLWLRLKWAV